MDKPASRLWFFRPKSGQVLSQPSLGLPMSCPSLLGDTLDGTASMNGVDREIIQDLLTELQISSQLGTQTDQLALGKALAHVC